MNVMIENGNITGYKIAAKETFVTFCGMVGLQAMVLGRLGRTENSPSKSVCSILPIAICGPGLSPAPALALPRSCVVKTLQGTLTTFKGEGVRFGSGRALHRASWSAALSSASLNRCAQASVVQP